MTTVDKQLMSDETVDALTLDVPSGSHAHSFDGGLTKTLIGGAHSHVFILPNGDTLRTELSGEHYHDIWMSEPGEWCGHGGIHAHGIVLPSGERVMTEDEGWHCHEWDNEGPGLPTGQHRHTLMLSSGLVLMSSMPGDKLWELAREASVAGQLVDMTKALGTPAQPSTYPPVEKRYDIDATAFLLDRASGVELSLEFEFSGRPVSLAMNIARKGAHEVDSISAVAAGFGVRGSRYTIDMLDASVPARLSKSLTTGSRAKGVDNAVVEKCKIDCGYQSATTREFYVKGDKLKGRIVVETSGEATVAKFTTDLTPCLIYKAACGTAEVPPYGTSGMPAWLSFACPTEHMYWQEPDRDIAKSKLEALAASNFYTADTIAFVNDDVRVIKREEQFSIYRPGGGATVLASVDTRKMSDALHRIKAVGNPGTWGASSEPGIDATHYALELCEGLTKFDLEQVATKIASVDRAYLIETPDSELAREAFSVLGPMFKLAGTREAGSLFVASFDPSLSGEAIEIVRASQAEVVKRVEAGEDPGYRRIIAKSDDTAEERIVYGVVLEPDGVDAQNDTISAETIRYAAHKFIEDFQNMGLQHKQMVNDKVKLLESYITLCDMQMGSEFVKTGTWLMVVRYDDDDLWAAVKSGRLTGFSIGGFAKRTQLQ